MALERDPEDHEAYSGIASTHWARKEVREAVAAYRNALRVKPDSVEALNGLGVALHREGELPEAAAALRQALETRPRFSMAYRNLGVVYSDMGARPEAVATYQQVIDLAPDDALAHCELGHALRRQGRFAESLAALRRGHQLGAQQPDWRHPSGQWVEQAERRLELDARLPAFLTGEARPKDVREQLDIAQTCFNKQLYGAAARFFEQAFRRDPGRTDDQIAAHRTLAARAAVLAGCGSGTDDPPSDPPARARGRGQALAWLRADLEAWAKVVATGTAEDQNRGRRALRLWRHHLDLAGVRSAEQLARLPTDEQEAWKKLWADVDGVLEPARDPQ
jgi:Tfp pilus assembly protein PilF